MTTVPDYAQAGMLRRPEFFDGAFHAIEGEPSVSNIMLTAGLDYTVSKQDIYFPHPDGISDPIRSQKHSVPWLHDNLTGKRWPLDVTVGRETYTTIQNDPIVTAITEVASAIGMTIEGAATFNSGGRVAMWGEFGDEFQIKGDPHQKVWVARWSHDGSWSAGFKAYVGRRWCGNMIPGQIMGAGSKAEVSIKHTKSSEFKVPLLAEAIATSMVSVEDYERVFLRLYDRKVEPQDLDKFLSTLFPIDPLVEQAPEHLLTAGQKRSKTMAMNKRAAVRDVFYNSFTQEDLRFTAAGVFHAAVEAFDHRMSGDRGYKIVNGDDIKAKAQALELALAI